MNRLGEAVLILSDLVGFPTITSESNLGLIEYLTDRLQPLGADIRQTHDETGAKANLFATIGPPIDGGIILSGHSDVVPADEVDWTGAPFIAMQREGRIFGRGTTDMKGFLACAVAMAPDFASAPLTRPIHLAVTFDEEVGCRGAPLLIADLATSGMKPAAAVVGEPTGMAIVTAHKGMHEYTTTITGLAAHASVPDSGINAVHLGARYVSGLLDLESRLADSVSPSSPYDPPHTTVSVGTISGGLARNVVAGECVIEWEMRPVSKRDAEHIIDEVREMEARLVDEMKPLAPEASIRTVTEGAVSGLEEDEASYATRLISDLVGSSETEVVSFGTEAGLYQAAGIPAVVCGPGDIEMAHRPDEYIELDQLAACLSFIDRLMGKLIEE